jgi:hypothetical protein
MRKDRKKILRIDGLARGVAYRLVGAIGDTPTQFLSYAFSFAFFAPFRGYSAAESVLPGVT